MVVGTAAVLAGEPWLALGAQLTRVTPLMG